MNLIHQYDRTLIRLRYLLRYRYLRRLKRVAPVLKITEVEREQIYRILPPLAAFIWLSSIVLLTYFLVTTR